MSTGPPEFVDEGGGRQRLRSSLHELWTFRNTLFAFAERDVRLKYKQTAFGVAWAVLQPLAFMVIFSLALGRFAKISGAGVPYAAFALSALVPWIYVQTAINFGSNAILNDAPLVRKIYFPREVPVLGAVLAPILDLGIGLILFATLGPFLGAHLSITLLLVPLLVVPLALLGAGIGLIFGALNVYYRDFRYVIPLTLQLWLFASPIAYPLSAVPEQWRLLYVAMNPLAGLLDNFRRVMALGELPDGKTLSISLVASVFVAWVGYWIFQSFAGNFADLL